MAVIATVWLDVGFCGELETEVTVGGTVSPDPPPSSASISVMVRS